MDVLAALPRLIYAEMTSTRVPQPAPGRSTWGEPTAAEAERPLAASSARAGLTAGGTDGNERLTVQTGALLFVLLAVLGITIVRIGQLTWLHLFLGLLLIGPVVLKLASTGYRFARYYTSDPPYRRKGPPLLALRVLGPVLVVCTVGVFATGVVLLALGPSSRQPTLLLHKVFFFGWLAVTALHVLGHLSEVERGLLGPRRVRAEVLAAAGDGRAARSRRPRTLAGLTLAPREPGSAGRALAIALSIAAGLALALALIPHFGVWVHYHHFHDH